MARSEGQTTKRLKKAPWGIPTGDRRVVRGGKGTERKRRVWNGKERGLRGRGKGRQRSKMRRKESEGKRREGICREGKKT